jgi:antitoxin (DNA-binding transcriptional repressor) of toxin-antitoxin stability system
VLTQTLTLRIGTAGHGGNDIIGDMAQTHMSEAELARDLHAVLERVRQGAEIVVEEGHGRVALITPVPGPGRPIDECIAIARARGSGAFLDANFAHDLSEIIAAREAVDTSAWE